MGTEQDQVCSSHSIRLVGLALAVSTVVAGCAAIEGDDLKLARSIMRPGYDLA